jgi:hypothetical protein
MALSVASGCAPAVPLLTGGATTPSGRADLGVGGAARIALGGIETVEPSAWADAADEAVPTGVVPVGTFRYGVRPGTSLGAMVAGSLLDVSVLHELAVDEADSLRPALLVGADAFGGLTAGGGRVGGNIPLLFGLNATSLLEVWVGLRAGIEVVVGEAGESAVDLFGGRIGGVVGLGAGFRHLHVLVELTAAYERWTGSIGETDIVADGVALTPAFALRLRL